MKKNIRIDPLTDTGVIDTNFFSSPDFVLESKMVLHYLRAEGFDETVQEFKITLLDRMWWISIN